MESSPRTARSFSSGIVLASVAIAVAAMALDHLIGTEGGDEEDGLADPGAFVASLVLAAVAAAVVLGVVVPRARNDERRKARTALGFGVAAVLTLPLVFLGFPFVLAGAGVALGLWARDDSRVGTAAAVLGGAALALATAAYVYAAVDLAL